MSSKQTSKQKTAKKKAGGRPEGYRSARGPCPGCGVEITFRAADGGPNARHRCDSQSNQRKLAASRQVAPEVRA